MHRRIRRLRAALGAGREACACKREQTREPDDVLRRRHDRRQGLGRQVHQRRDHPASEDRPLSPDRRTHSAHGQEALSPSKEGQYSSFAAWAEATSAARESPRSIETLRGPAPGILVALPPSRDSCLGLASSYCWLTCSSVTSGRRAASSRFRRSASLAGSRGLGGAS
jgi:hypothetical protein